MKNAAYLITLVLLGMGIAANVQASVEVGDVIGINFHHSLTGGEANWNNLANDNLSIAAGSVIRLEGAGGTGVGDVVTGVSISVPAGNGFTDDGNAEGWTTSGGGNPDGDPYGYYTDTDALNDIQHQGSIDLTISGLDPNLRYNVIIYSFIGSASTVSDSFGVNGGTLVASTRGARWASSSPVVFSGESAPGGTLVVNSNIDTSANVFWNAVVIEVLAAPSSLVGLYTFEGTSPAAFDDVSGQKLDPHPSSIDGSVTLDASGYEGQAASFSGTHTSIEIPFDINPTARDELTIGAWVKPDAIGTRAVFGNDNGGWDRGLAVGGTLGNPNWRPVGDGGGQVDSGIPVSVGAWQFVAVSYDYAVEHKFYKDTNTYSRATASTGTGDTTMGLGALDFEGTWKFDGLIDNFFIFSNVLNNAEVQQIRVNGLSGIEDVAAGLDPVTINVTGDGSGYDETGMQGFRSTNVTKTYDVEGEDGDNVYGTEGLFFIGDSANGPAYFDATFANFTQVGATWTSFSAGSDASNYNNPAGAWNYSDIDDPSATPGVDVADWSIQSGYVRQTADGTVGDWDELLTFTTDNTAPDKFRVGVMAGHFDNGAFHPSALRLVADSGTTYEVTAEVTGLSTAPARLTGMVFFDVNLNGRSAATFSVFGQRPATRGASLAGIMFDEMPPSGTTLIVR